MVAAFTNRDNMIALQFGDIAAPPTAPLLPPAQCKPVGCADLRGMYGAHSSTSYRIPVAMDSSITLRIAGVNAFQDDLVPLGVGALPVFGACDVSSSVS